MSENPPNWDQRPRVKPWNEGATPEYLATLDKDDLISRIGLLNAQMTTAMQESLDRHNRHAWEQHQLIEALGVAGRAYRKVLAANRAGRKTVRIADLMEVQ